MFLCIGKGVYEIVEKYSRTKASGFYTDIRDGAVYQQLVATGFLSNPHNISLQLNTDGVPVFKSSGYLFWPLHLLINELPPSIRFFVMNH